MVQKSAAAKSVSAKPGARTWGAHDRDTGRVLSRKRAILRAAGEAFRARGYHATSMREVAAACGMAVGNLYYYFRSKPALLAFCQLETAGRLLAMARTPAIRALPPHERLRWMIVAHVYCVHESFPGAAAHVTLDPLPEPERSQCVRRRDRYERALRAVIEEGVAAGVFREVDPKVAAWTILGALNATVSWYRRGGARSARDLGAQMADLLVRGLLADGAALDEAPELDESGFEEAAAAAASPVFEEDP